MRGGFTLPGEAGYEALTLEMAKRWDADMIRDSDGTRLSDELFSAGYGVYSTVCPIREHNEWIREHPDARQQTFLCTAPVVAEGERLRIDLMRDFFREQFEINEGAQAFWQVHDRTTGVELPRSAWRYLPECGAVEIDATPFRQYTVSFLAFRVWEEISMYNHVTNGWRKEHLMQLDPYPPEARAYLRGWMEDWLAQHPQTRVVRFTSLFYNFAWIWGSDARNRCLFSDWASYDFTVSPAALVDFAKAYGYRLTAEDFVNRGKYRSTHTVPTARKRDWMEFIGAFVREMAGELVEQVHRAGKLAYVFYDDSWVGMEPYSGHFAEMGFDGIIKCVFSGYEARLCAGIPVQTHELRFHPYLFPVGLGGAPTFSPGGSPGRDALLYWVRVRRALLRAKIERVGLGGYLHLIEGYPDFVEAMDGILSEFRQIADLHAQGAPEPGGVTVGVLTAWGSLRSWTLSGHFHETDSHTLIHVLESLSGLPVEVRFLSFEDVAEGALSGVDVLINAGRAGSAWSGGACWENARAADAITEWVHGGGALLGIGEPSALPGGHRAFRMAHVLGVDADDVSYACHGVRQTDMAEISGLAFEPSDFRKASPVRAISAETRALCRDARGILAAIHPFGKGMGLYLADYAVDPAHTRMLFKLLCYAATGQAASEGMPEDPLVECAVFAGAGKIVLTNQSEMARAASCAWRGTRYASMLPPYGMAILPLRQGA